MVIFYVTMTEKDKKVRQEGDSPLEALRLDHTQMNQDEFTLRCGIPKTTYFRWVTGKTPVRLTPQQVAAVCLVCNISLRTMFQYLGVDVDNLPTGSSVNIPDKTGHSVQSGGNLKETDSLNLQSSPGEVFLRSLRRKLDISQERLAAVLGISSKTVSRCELGETEIELTIRQFKKLGALVNEDRLSQFPDYLGKPPEEDPEKQQE